jgi:hypothetical protein
MSMMREAHFNMTWRQAHPDKPRKPKDWAGSGGNQKAEVFRAIRIGLKATFFGDSQRNGSHGELPVVTIDFGHMSAAAYGELATSDNIVRDKNS